MPRIAGISSHCKIWSSYTWFDKCLASQHPNLSQVSYCTVATSSWPAYKATRNSLKATLQIHAAKLRTEDGLGVHGLMIHPTNMEALVANGSLYLSQLGCRMYYIGTRGLRTKFAKRSCWYPKKGVDEQAMIERERQIPAKRCTILNFVPNNPSPTSTIQHILSTIQHIPSTNICQHLPQTYQHHLTNLSGLGPPLVGKTDRGDSRGKQWRTPREKGNQLQGGWVTTLHIGNGWVGPYGPLDLCAAEIVFCGVDWLHIFLLLLWNWGIDIFENLSTRNGEQRRWKNSAPCEDSGFAKKPCIPQGTPLEPCEFSVPKNSTTKGLRVWGSDFLQKTRRKKHRCGEGGISTLESKSMLTLPGGQEKKWSD